MEANNGSSGQSLSDFTILGLQIKVAALEAEVEKFTSANKQSTPPVKCDVCKVQDAVVNCCHDCYMAT